MKSYQFKQVDVFTDRPLRGNPVAVVLGADGLTAGDMQRLATWTNLSETTFVLSPTRAEADYQLRIFTPKSELPFAGHPSIGSAHAVLESGLVEPQRSHFVQECEAGLLPVRVERAGDTRHLFVQTPAASVTPCDPARHAELAAALGPDLPPEPVPLRVDVGPVWLIVQLDSAASVHSLQPDLTAVTQLSHALGLTGVTVFGLTGGGPSAVYTRSFAPALNVPEDPVCGSGNASVAAFLAHSDQLGTTGPNYVASQGHELGRDGFVHIAVSLPERTIQLGGASVTCVEGSLRV